MTTEQVAVIGVGGVAAIMVHKHYGAYVTLAVLVSTLVAYKLVSTPTPVNVNKT